MIKNTAGQKIGAQMVSATDGSAFTGAVTVSVTGDAGTQATGSVGSGACTHEGNGFHTYAPAQAETNYDHIAFTFIGSGAVPVTVQVFTVAGDAFTRLGAPAGASIAADLLVIDNLVDDLESRLGTPSNLGGGATIAANLSDIEAQTDDIGAAGAGLTALATAANLATVAGYLDTEMAATLAIAQKLDTAMELDGSVYRFTVNALELSPTGGSAPTAAAIADAVWEEAIVDHSGVTGSTAEALGAAGSAGDPWTTALPGSYTGTQAGALLSNVETRLGTPSNLGGGATVAQNLFDIEAQTDDIGAAGAGLTAADDAILTAIGALNNLSSAQAQTAATAALNAYDPPTKAEVDAAIAPVEVDTQDIQSRLPAALVGGRMDSTVDGTGMEAGAIDAILDDTIGDSTLTVRQALRVLVAGMAGKLSGAASTTITIRNIADSANVIVATVDADGNRSAVVVTP